MAETIIQKSLGDAIASRYKPYAIETLAERAIPDIRDGLKPVHLRILYCMYKDLGLTHNHKTIKSAKVTGAVLGNYHPHGDQSVYDAMVGMTQPWNMRYPLIDWQGSYGGIDGDPAAASRYTECRLSKYGEYMMKDIDKNVVDFRPNYDDTLQEPIVASGLICNSLLNAVSGIACGFSTTIASHNLTEVYNALDYIIDKSLQGEEPEISELMKLIPAPDFPTGGIIVNNNEWYKIFTEGKGKVVVRAKYEILSNKKGTTIQVTEIPYGVNKLKLVNSIEEKINNNVFTDIKEVIDASSEGNINIQIVLKKNANPQMVVNNLFAKTELQTNFNYNMTTLLNKQLKQASILDCLYDFLDHGLEIIVRRTQYDLDKLNKRVHLLEGITMVLSNLDNAIEIIKTADNPLEDLMAEFNLDNEQASHILNMKLRSINNQDANKIQEELNNLLEKRPILESIINDEEVTMQKLREELAEIKNEFGDDRRTEIDLTVDSTIDIEDLIEEEDLVVTITSDSNIKSVSAKEYNSQKRGGKGNKAAATKDDEVVIDLFSVKSKDDLIFITNTGRAHVLKAYKIPKVSRNSKGKNIVNYLTLNEGEYPVSTLATNISSNQDSTLTIITKRGVIKRISLNQLSTKFSYTNIISLDEGDDIVKAILTNDTDEVMIVTEEGLYVRFPVETVRPMGRSARGVTAIRFKREDDCVLTMTSVSDNDQIIVVSTNGFGRRTLISEYSASKNRGGKGFMFYKPTDRTGKVAACVTINNNEDLLITTSNGSVIRTPSEGVSQTSKGAGGVKLINLNEGDTIASVAKIVPQQEEEVINE